MVPELPSVTVTSLTERAEARRRVVVRDGALALGVGEGGLAGGGEVDEEGLVGLHRGVAGDEDGDGLAGLSRR